MAYKGKKKKAVVRVCWTSVIQHDEITAGERLISLAVGFVSWENAAVLIGRTRDTSALTFSIYAADGRDTYYFGGIPATARDWTDFVDWLLDHFEYEESNEYVREIRLLVSGMP